MAETVKSSYHGVMQGDHPAINHIGRDKLDGKRRVLKALDLYLSDAFFPLCTAFFERVAALSRTDIQAVQNAHTICVEKRDFNHGDFSNLNDDDSNPFGGLDGSPSYTTAYRRLQHALQDEHVKRYRSARPDGPPTLRDLIESTAVYDAMATRITQFPQDFFEWKYAYNDGKRVITDVEESEYERQRSHNVRNSYFNSPERSDIYPDKFKSFMFTLPETAESSVFQGIMIPVGEYGRFFAIKMLVAEKSLLLLSEHLLLNDAVEVGKHYHELTYDHTARGTMDQKANPAAPLVSFQEGIVTIGQALGLLTAQKVKGFGTGDELLEAIIRQNILGRFARMLPPGHIGPNNLEGRYRKGILEANNKKELRLNTEFVKEIAEQKKKFARSSSDTGVPTSAFTGFGCPVGKTVPEYHTSGIDLVAQAYVQVYNSSHQ